MGEWDRGPVKLVPGPAYISMPEDTHPLLTIAAALEVATDDLGAALDEHAEAEVAYKRAWSIALLRDDKVAATLRAKFAEAHCVEEQARLLYADARVKRCRAKCEQLDSQLRAHQSYNRIVNGQT
jgi:hypothetical protein